MRSPLRGARINGAASRADPMRNRRAGGQTVPRTDRRTDRSSERRGAGALDPPPAIDHDGEGMANRFSVRATGRAAACVLQRSVTLPTSLCAPRGLSARRCGSGGTIQTSRLDPPQARVEAARVCDRGADEARRKKEEEGHWRQCIGLSPHRHQVPRRERRRSG